MFGGAKGHVDHFVFNTNYHILSYIVCGKFFYEGHVDHNVVGEGLWHRRPATRRGGSGGPVPSLS